MAEELYALMKQTVIDGEVEEAEALAQKGLDAGQRFPCTWRFPLVLARARNFRIGRTADILPTRRHSGGRGVALAQARGMR